MTPLSLARNCGFILLIFTFESQLTQLINILFTLGCTYNKTVKGQNDHLELSSSLTYLSYFKPWDKLRLFARKSLGTLYCWNFHFQIFNIFLWAAVLILLSCWLWSNSLSSLSNKFSLPTWVGTKVLRGFLLMIGGTTDRTTAFEKWYPSVLTSRPEVARPVDLVPPITDRWLQLLIRT